MSGYAGFRPHRTECEALPKGWIREETVTRLPNPGAAGQRSEVNYISPMGKRIRSKPELLKILGHLYDLTCFDFETGKMNPALLHKGSGSAAGGTGPHGQHHGRQTASGTGSGGAKGVNGKAASASSAAQDFSRAIRADASLVPPIRQTASIFKQPVTVYKTASSRVVALGGDGAKEMTSRVKDDKHTKGEKGRQLFWEKRLSGLRASYPSEDYQPFSLPDGFKPIGPGIKNDLVLASISTNLHINSGPIYGQKGGKGMQEEDPYLYINPDQPLVTKTAISREALEKLEARVNSTRSKLAKALLELRS